VRNAVINGAEQAIQRRLDHQLAAKEEVDEAGGIGRRAQLRGLNCIGKAPYSL